MNTRTELFGSDAIKVGVGGRERENMPQKVVEDKSRHHGGTTRYDQLAVISIGSAD